MEDVLFPHRLFAVGEEPDGLRVTPYHKPGAIKHIIETLEEEEIEVLKSSSFGKFIELADQPPYSGRLGRFMLPRQLKVNKKYEAWFLFSDNPIRFSLREFAIVTRLPCGKYPETSSSVQSNPIKEQPYYSSLFGMLKEVSVANVIKMLKRRTVTDKEIRIKYACLALLSSVILPTSHTPKILVEHAERIKDLDEFFAYPWGRVAFEMLIGSIKERDEVSLCQSTIALRGFVQSLQMVMTKAVPALTEVVREDFANDACGVDNDFMVESPPRKDIKPAHARTLYASENVSTEIDASRL